jgi:hypothetical protein
MIGLLFMAILALFVLGAVVWLAEGRTTEDPSDAYPLQNLAGRVWNESGLILAERVFDPTDYNWLHDELCFPKAAHLLASHRKRLAIHWLSALRNSFNELIRLPEPATTDGGEAPGNSSWQLLWLTLRFHLILSYAFLVVRIFGPYHRLVPFLGWLNFLKEYGIRKPPYGEAGAGRMM